MKKFTLFFMSMFLVLGIAMAQDAAKFELQYVNPQDGAKVTSVYNVVMGFTKDVTVTLPEGGIDVVNNDTKEVTKITRIYSDEWSAKNQVNFLFEQVMAEGKEGKEELRDKVIETPGNYSYTIPAGVIKSVDGEEFPETTFTFSIVGTFSLVSYSPAETTSLDKIELTFDKEVVEVKIPASGMYLLDYYWSPVTKVSNAVISNDKKTVTLELEEAITTPGTYNLDVYQGVFISTDGINKGASLSFSIIDPTPSFSTTYNDGDKVKELSNVFEITFKNVNEVVLVENKMTVYLPGGGSVDGEAQCENNKITVTFDTQFTEEGDYLFYIPAGMFTMDGVENEEREINVNLFTFTITPLQIVSVTPEVGKVDQIEKIVITFNQNIQLSYNEDWQQISRELSLTCGEEEYTLTYAPETWNVTNELVYLVNAKWNGYDKYESTPITAAGTYTLNLADIVVDHAVEDGTDEYGYPAKIWHAKNVACQGTYTWTIGDGDNAVKFVGAEAGEQAIYDLLGRRVEKITTAGIYIVNGRKMIIK